MGTQYLQNFSFIHFTISFQIHFKLKRLNQHYEANSHNGIELSV